MPSVTISTGASELLPKNTSRKSLIIQNEDATDSAYIKMERSENTSVSSTVHDYKIGPGGSISLNALMDGTQQIQARFTIVATANTPRINFFETEDIIR